MGLFSLVINRVKLLDCHQRLVSAQYLENESTELDQILYMQ